MPLYTKRQGLQASQDEKTIERASDCADRILQKCNLISEFLVFPNNDHAADQVGMTVQIFRCGMHNDIKTRFNRSLDPWSSERIIANGNQLSFACDFRDCIKIDELEQRIARGFDPNHTRVWLDCALEIFRVGQIDIGKIKVGGAPADAIEQAKCTAIQVIARDDM